MNTTQSNNAGDTAGDFSNTPSASLQAFKAYVEAEHHFAATTATYRMVSAGVKTLHDTIRKEGVGAAELPDDLLEIVEQAERMKAKAAAARTLAMDKAFDSRRAWEALSQ